MIRNVRELTIFQFTSKLKKCDGSLFNGNSDLLIKAELDTVVNLFTLPATPAYMKDLQIKRPLRGLWTHRIPWEDTETG